ncbi:MAG: hypothetical protein QOK03_105 [Candidatus Binataceae bacterium]|nr:hypothetical protein [Candidatus Binataceae bacterium]
MSLSYRVKPTKLAAILLAVALAIGAAVTVGPMFAPECTLANGTDVVTVSTDDLSRGSARFFCYRDHSGHLIRFVLARGDDGAVHSLFDACRQCYRFHKGYTVANGFLICRLCGNRYKFDRMHLGLASCQPVQIENTERDGKVEVRVAALEEGHALF